MDKFIKKILLTTIVIINLLIFTSCVLPDMGTSGAKVKLHTPSVSLNENVAVWNQIDNSLRYEISLNDEIFYVDLSIHAYLLKENDTFRNNKELIKRNELIKEQKSTIKEQKQELNRLNDVIDILNNQIENLQAKFDKFKEKMYNFCNKIC